MSKQELVQKHMRIIEDFPSPGISFKDITTVLQNPQTLEAMVDVLKEALEGISFDYILGVEARGFICGAALAYATGTGFLMARKPGKLPGHLIREEYELEYGSATVELDVDSVPDGAKVVVLDDLLATGGTARAVCHLVEKAGGKVVCVEFLAELTDLGGRKVLEEEGYPVISVLQWDH